MQTSETKQFKKAGDIITYMSEQAQNPDIDGGERLSKLLGLEENDPRIEKISEIVKNKQQGAVEFQNGGRIRIVAGRAPVDNRIEYVIRLTDGGDGTTDDQYERLTQIAQILTNTLGQEVLVNAKK